MSKSPGFIEFGRLAAGNVGSCRGCRRWESNPHEGYPSEDFKSSGHFDAKCFSAMTSEHISEDFSPHLPLLRTDLTPELVELITAWPALPEKLKATIMLLVRTVATGRADGMWGR